jgi:hypothetical protein
MGFFCFWVFLPIFLQYHLKKGVPIGVPKFLIGVPPKKFFFLKLIVIKIQKIKERYLYEKRKIYKGFFISINRVLQESAILLFIILNILSLIMGEAIFNFFKITSSS